MKNDDTSSDVFHFFKKKIKIFDIFNRPIVKNNMNVDNYKIKKKEIQKQQNIEKYNEIIVTNVLDILIDNSVFIMRYGGEYT